MGANNIKMNMDGTIRAKVLQYKADGNTLTEKWHNLTKFAEGIYYKIETDDYNQNYAYFAFEADGIFWDSLICDRAEYIKERRGRIEAERNNFEATILDRAKAGRFINTLQIEIMKRLGHNVAPLIASREAAKARMAEERRAKAEEKERKERERKEAEELRKAEALADSKEKLLNRERITVEQIELIAKAVSYKINIRTLGTMRKKLISIGMDNYECRSDKNTSFRSFEGAFKVVSELYDRVKAEADRQPATPSETPLIPTQTAEVENVPGEGEQAAEKTENNICAKIIKHRNYWDVLECENRHSEWYVEVAAFFKQEAIPGSDAFCEFERLTNAFSTILETHEQIGHLSALLSENRNHLDKQLKNAIEKHFGQKALVSITQTMPQSSEISTETAETEILSGEGEKEAVTANNKPSSADVMRMVQTELAKNKAMCTTWKLEFPNGDECLVRHNYTLPMPYGDQYVYEEARNGHVFFSNTCDSDGVVGWICLKMGIGPPQPGKTA